MIAVRRKAGWIAWLDKFDGDGVPWYSDISAGASRFTAEMAAARTARELALELSAAANEAIRTAKTLPDPMDPAIAGDRV